jgi:hypothetical protein
VGVFDRFLGGLAPVHVAEVYEPKHDGRMHLLEARRGRGKSYGMTYWGYCWLIDRLPEIVAGNAPHSKLITNFNLDRHRIATRLCVKGHMHSFSDALDLVHERVIYASSWDDFFVSYQCGLLLDECNRSLDAYNKKSSEMLTLAHDWHQQTRKHKNTLVYATQYVDWINVQTRKLFDLLWRAKVVRHRSQRGPDGLRVPLRFNYYGSDPMANGADSAVVRRADFKFQIPFELGIARMYGSWDPIVTFPGDSKPRWTSFHELAEWMTKNGLRPAPTPRPLDRLSLYHKGRERLDWQFEHDYELSPVLPAGERDAGLTDDVQVPCAAAGRLAAPLDLSTLPTSFPKELL